MPSGSALVPVSSTVRHEVERPVRMLLRKRFASAPSDQRVLFQNPIQDSHNDKAVLALSLDERLHVRKLILQNRDPRDVSLPVGVSGSMCPP